MTYFQPGIYGPLEINTSGIIVTGNISFTGSISGNGSGLTGVVATGLGTLAQNLLFVDNTYDIGQSGATRPRDLFLSRDLTVGRYAIFTEARALTSAGLDLSNSAGTVQLRVGAGGGSNISLLVPTTLSSYLMVGTSPPVTGALRVDAASYSNIGISILGGTGILTTTTTSTQSTSEYTAGSHAGYTGIISNGFRMGSSTATTTVLVTSGSDRWYISQTASTSAFVAAQANARIVGGSSNGLAIRNSGDTRDNFVIADNGASAAINNGTNDGWMAVGVLTGEMTAGVRFAGINASSGSWLLTNANGTNGLLGGVAYFNGAAWYSALEVANVAGGGATRSNLLLMKSGGNVIIGTDPGTSNVLRVGGTVVLSNNSAYGWASRSQILSPSDGNLLLANNAATNFGYLQFGGTTSSFPALNRQGTGLHVRLADGTDGAHLQFGASPPNSGAIRVDGVTYTSAVFRAANSTCLLNIDVNTTTASVYTNSAHGLILGANGSSRWSLGITANISELFSSQVTARIVGGSSNGLAIRNSGNTRDNFRVSDSANIAQLDDGTYLGAMRLTNATGEIPNSIVLSSENGNGSVGLAHWNGTLGRLVFAAYWDGTQYRSAWEVANVSSGFGTLALMKSGGTIQHGPNINYQSPPKVSSTGAAVNLITIPANKVAILDVLGTNGVDSFADRVAISMIGAGTFVVITTTTLTGTPGARTYSFSTGTFRVSMASGYTVHAIPTETI